MKKFIGMFLAGFIALPSFSCTSDGTQSQPTTETEFPAQTQSITPTASPSVSVSPETVEPDVSAPTFDGKIAIITDNVGLQNNIYYTALPVVAKYGEEKVTRILACQIYGRAG